MAIKSPNFPVLPATLEKTGPANAGTYLVVSVTLGFISCLWIFQWAGSIWEHLLAILLVIASVIFGRWAIVTPCVTTLLTDQKVRVRQKSGLSKPRIIREEPLSAFTGVQLSAWRDGYSGDLSIDVCLVHPDPDRELTLYEAPFPVNNEELSARLREARTILQEACQRLKIPQLKDRNLLKWDRYLECARTAEEDGDYKEAVSQTELALKEVEVLGEQDQFLRDTLYSLANLHHRQGHLRKAEPLYQRALAIDEKILGLEHPDLVRILKNLAGLYYARCSYVKAEPLYQRVLAIMEKTRGLEHSDLAPILKDLADVYRRHHKYKEAEPLYKRVLTLQEKALLPDHRALIGLLKNYAFVLRTLERTNEASKLEARARKLSAKYPGK